MQELEPMRKEAVLPSSNQPTTTLVIENIPSEALNIDDVVDSYFDKGPSEEEIEFIRAMGNQNIYTIREVRQDFRNLTDDYQQEILEIIKNQEKEHEHPKSLR